MDISDAVNLDTSSKTSILVAKKQLDAQREEGAAAISLIKSAAQSAPQARGGVSAAPGALDVVG